MDIKKDFGTRIKEIRNKKGLTQYKLAELVNIDPKHISHIETGRSFPKADLIEKFAIALEVDYTEFFKTKHLKPKAALIKEIAKLLENADNDSVKTIYKLVAGYFD